MDCNYLHLYRGVHMQVLAVVTLRVKLSRLGLELSRLGLELSRSWHWAWSDDDFNNDLRT